MADLTGNAQYDAITAAIKAFKFWDYGLDEADPNSEYAEWVPDLAGAIHKAVGEHDAATREAAIREGAAAIKAFVDNAKARFRGRSDGCTGAMAARELLLKLIAEPPAAGPQDGLSRVQEAVRKARGGEAPPTVRGFA